MVPGGFGASLLFVSAWPRGVLGDSGGVGCFWWGLAWCGSLVLIVLFYVWWDGLAGVWVSFQFARLLGCLCAYSMGPRSGGGFSSPSRRLWAIRSSVWLATGLQYSVVFYTDLGFSVSSM